MRKESSSREGIQQNPSCKWCTFQESCSARQKDEAAWRKRTSPRTLSQRAAATNERQLASETALGSKGHRPDNLPTNLANQHRATRHRRAPSQTAFSSRVTASASPASTLAEESPGSVKTDHGSAHRSDVLRSSATRYTLEDRVSGMTPVYEASGRKREFIGEFV